MRKNLIKDDNYFNVTRFTSIIDWIDDNSYKHANKRFVLPSFYYTSACFRSLKRFFFKNIFRKKLQRLQTLGVLNKLNCFVLFEEKFWLKGVLALDFFKKNNLYYFFFKNKHIINLNRDKFFFKNINFNFVDNSSFIVDKFINIDNEVSKETFITTRHCFTIQDDLLLNSDFNVLFYFYIFNACLIEFYKINIYIFFKLNNF